MNAILERLKNPLVLAAIAFIVGLLFGWLAIGWGLWPVKFVGAYPEHLLYEQKVEYLRTSIEAFGQNGDAAKAKTRYDSIGEGAEKALTEIVQKPGGLSPELIMAFGMVATGKAPTVVSPVQQTPGAEVTPVAEVTPEPAKPAEEKKSLLSSLWPVLCLLALVLAGILVYVFILRGRAFKRTGEVTPAMEAEEARRQAPYTDYSSTGSEAPIAQFMASYKIGDDLFDDSFSIDSASGEFLGECGVGISDTIGIGDPKKVTAFEVWLFDKNDIQTVTKVLMSYHAFQDVPTRQRLEAKGEPVLAEPGSEAVLETQTLQLVARVVNMAYTQGSALPADSHFDTLVLEIAIWQK